MPRRPLIFLALLLTSCSAPVSAPPQVTEAPAPKVVPPPPNPRTPAEQKLYDQLRQDIAAKDVKLSVDSAETIIRESRDPESLALARITLSEFWLAMAQSNAIPAVGGREIHENFIRRLEYVNKSLEYNPVSNSALYWRALILQGMATADYPNAARHLEAALADLAAIQSPDRSLAIDIRRKREQIESSLKGRGGK